MSQDLPSLDDQDYEELDQLLQKLGAEDGLRLDGAQGLLTALAVGPRPVGPEVWLPVILGGEPVGVPPEMLQSLLRLLLRLLAMIERGLEVYAFDPILAEVEDEADGVDVSGWCEGFSLGVDLQAELWEQRLQEEDQQLIDLLSPIVALGVDDGVFAEIRDTEVPPLADIEREHLLQQLPGILIELRQYWREHPSEEPPQGTATLH